MQGNGSDCNGADEGPANAAQVEPTISKKKAAVGGVTKMAARKKTEQGIFRKEVGISTGDKQTSTRPREMAGVLNIA